MTDDIVEGEVEVVEEKAMILSNAALMPAMSVQDAMLRRKQINEVVAGIMVEDKDYGTIPGTQKPKLYKPGAEKLTTFFGLAVTFINEGKEERWDDDDPLFYYMEKCQLHKGNMLIAEASGSANSREDRYRWRWTTDKAKANEERVATRVSTIGHFRWQIEKAETSGKYGKPQEYWDKFTEAEKDGTLKVSQKTQAWKNNETAEFNEIETVEYRIPNPDIFTLVNTILKMAQKRALVAATLIACDASEFFTQDLEDGVTEIKKEQPPEQTPKKKKSSAGDPSTHALNLLDDKNATDADLTTAFWQLGRSMRMNDDYLTGLVQESASEDGTNWRDALRAVLEHKE